MIKKNRLIKILSLSNGSNAELKEFYMFMKHANLDDFMHSVKASKNIKNYNSKEDFTKEKVNRKQLTIFDDINFVRTHNLSVPTDIFAKMLTKKLNQRNPQIEIPEFNSKKGLRSWIKSLSNRMSEREIYSAALSLAISDQKADWML